MHSRFFENGGDRTGHARQSFARGSRGVLKRVACCGLVIASMSLLAGCVDSYMGAPQSAAPDPNAIARRPGVSPSGTTVAVVSFSGGPDGVKQRFATAFDTAARAQDIVMATPDAADYLVRGYINATPAPEGDGTEVTYVLDVFDAKKHRTERLKDEIVLKAASPDPWSVVDDSALSAVAAKSSGALAAMLTNTPQAIAASQTRPDPTLANAAAQQPNPTIVAASPVPGNPGNLLLH